MSTTPLEREILTHYFTTPGPFPRQTQFIKHKTEEFVRLGLLRIGADGLAEGNDSALRPYMDALGRVPLPTQVWKVPETK